jgi:tetratricopeptide (TPR) repeat protein
MKIEWIEKHMTEAEKMISEGDQLELGMGILNNLLYEEPGYGRLHNHIGWAHLYYTEDLNQAELHLKTAIKFSPEYSPPYLHIAKLYIVKEKYEEAIAILTDALSQPEANRARLYELIGQCHEMMHEFKLATRAYREAMLASVDSYHTQRFAESIKRCRAKRWKAIF